MIARGIGVRFISIGLILQSCTGRAVRVEVRSPDVQMSRGEAPCRSLQEQFQWEVETDHHLAMDGAFFREKGPLSAGGELNHNNGSGTIHPGFYPYAATVSVSYASADRKPESGAANLR